jgi:hypothetical protein
MTNKREFFGRLVPAGPLLLCLGLSACQVQRSHPIAENVTGAARAEAQEADPSKLNDGPNADPNDAPAAQAYARLMRHADKVTISFDYWNAGYTQSRMLRFSSSGIKADTNPDQIRLTVKQIRAILGQMFKAGYFQQARLGGGDFPPDGPRMAIRVHLPGGPRFTQIRQVDDSAFVMVHWVSQYVPDAVRQRVHQFARQAHDLSNPPKNRALAEARQAEIQKAVLRAFAKLKTPNRVFATLPVGSKHGLVVGQAFLVHQGKRVLGQVRFIQVQATHSFVEITPRKIKKDQKDTPAIIARLIARQVNPKS